MPTREDRHVGHSGKQLKPGAIDAHGHEELCKRLRGDVVPICNIDARINRICFALLAFELIHTKNRRMEHLGYSGLVDDGINSNPMG